MEAPTPPVITFDNATGSVNSSEIWITNAGNLDNVNSTQMSGTGGVLTILESWLFSLASGNPFDQSLNTTDSPSFQNLTLASKITFAFGEVIDNIVDGWIRVTGNLNVTGNIEVKNITIDNSIKDSNSDTRIFFENGTFVVEG